MNLVTVIQFDYVADIWAEKAIMKMAAPFFLGKVDEKGRTL